MEASVSTLCFEPLLTNIVHYFLRAQFMQQLHGLASLADVYSAAGRIIKQLQKTLQCFTSKRLREKPLSDSGGWCIFKTCQT